MAVSQEFTLRVPQLGAASRVEVLARLVEEGASVPAGGATITLGFGSWEFDIPGPMGARLVKWLANDGDELISGAPLAVLRNESEADADAARVTAAASTAATTSTLEEAGDHIFNDGFGTVERRPLSRIRRVSAARLQQGWATVPQVTHLDDADVTELETALAQSAHAAAANRVSLLALTVRAVTAALDQHPGLSASFEQQTASILLKRYRHIGVAVETPQGLIVPVVHDVDRKSASQVSVELKALAARAREGRVSPAALEGGCFTISSLGNIGGTSFTPIVNPPQVAILGIARIREQLRLRAGQVETQRLLPLCLSYDHRAVDGADAARFLVAVRSHLENPAWIASECSS